jgi:ribonuclease P protein component
MRVSRDFDTAVRRGRRAGRRTLVVHACFRADSGSGAGVPAKVGLVVSKGVGSAVVRNRVKRRLRAAMVSRMAALPPGALVVLRANPASASASSADLLGDLDSALRRALDAERGHDGSRDGSRG